VWRMPGGIVFGWTCKRYDFVLITQGCTLEVMVEMFEMTRETDSKRWERARCSDVAQVRLQTLNVASAEEGNVIGGFGFCSRNRALGGPLVTAYLLAVRVLNSLNPNCFP
jgi:hypothetical protein